MPFHVIVLAHSAPSLHRPTWSRSCAIPQCPSTAQWDDICCGRGSIPQLNRPANGSAERHHTLQTLRALPTAFRTIVHFYLQPCQGHLLHDIQRRSPRPTLKAGCAPRHIIPVRLSANPSATAQRLQSKAVSACRGLPSQYFRVSAASQARRFAPVILDAAKRKSAICDGVIG
jgi:hypothetical protein